MDLFLLGSIFLVGLIADLIGRYTWLPRISVLLLSGLLIGPAGFALISAELAAAWFPTLTQMALAMIGFLIGQKVTPKVLKQQGSGVVWLSIAKALGAAMVVFVACLALALPLPLALVLAGIAPATAPAATFDVVHETGAQGTFTDTLLAVVALDDAWGLILFALLLALATSTGVTLEGITAGLTEIVGSLCLGAALGVPMALITGRIQFGERPGEPILAEALGFVFLAAGLSLLLGLSPILTAVSMGAVVTGLAKHHNQPFDAIEGIEWPFMVLFFVLAGASLELNYLASAGLLVFVYLISRSVGTVAGVMLGGLLVGVDRFTRSWLGPALLPQAGVALGLSLIAAQQLPEHGQSILSIVLASTIILELTSPILTRSVLRRAMQKQKLE